MKLARTLLALAVFVPALAFATTSIDLANQGGVLSGSSAGLSLTGSELIAINVNGSLFTGNLGTMNFTTGGLLSGTLAEGGVFGDGAFSIASNGLDGFPNGTLFSGAFTGPVTWAELTLANGTHEYTLTGTISGTWYTGQKVVGATIQLTTNTGKGVFCGRGVKVASGDTNLTITTPEPGSLSLLGTGLVAIGGLLRRKLAMG